MYSISKGIPLTKLTTAVLALALLIGGLGATVQPAQASVESASACAEYHRVQRGEYLSQIAKEYEVSWRWLAEINDLDEPSLIYPGQNLCVALKDGSADQPVIPVTGNVASFSILSVIKGKSVTVQAANYPAYTEFRVLMDEIGTKAEDGIKAGSATTAKDGSFRATFNIPAALQGESLIAIRIEATGRSGHYAYNWFRNATTSVAGSPSPSTGTPAVSVVSVAEDTSVTIKAQNLPAYQAYVVWFERLSGQSGVAGVKASTLTTSRDGSINATIRIPREMVDRNVLALRLQAVDGSGNLVSNWFSNVTSEDEVGSGAPYGSRSSVPGMSIREIDKNQSVSLEGYRFPARKEVTVWMGKMGTQGLNGVKVDTVKTDKNGSFSETFKIPKELRDKKQIAIRLQSADGSGYYAYNWFNNKDMP
jgi:LysM repeat protein